MRQPRSLVPIPKQLAAEIDKIAGQKRRSAFIVDLIEREIRRRDQLSALNEAAGSWTDEKHPELASGADPWIRELRGQSAARLEKLHRQRNAK